MNFSLGDLRYYFGQSTFLRGAKHAAEQRVSQIDIKSHKNYVLIHARVKGSRSKPYTVNINIGTTGEFDCSGECSCPMEYNCKHVVAALMAAQRFVKKTSLAQSTTKNELTQWLAALQTPSVDTAVIPAPKKTKTLIYVLDTENQGKHQTIIVQLFLAEKSVGDTYKKLQQFNPESETHWASVIADDEKILAILMFEQKKSQTYRLGDKHKYHLSSLNENRSGLLTALLQTQRCFWQDTSTQPLVLAEPKTVAFSWQADEEGTQRLMPTADNQPVQLLASDKPYYIDKSQHICGPALMDTDRQLLERLLTSPPVSAENAAFVVQQLQKLSKSYPQLPLPKIFNLTAIKKIKPVPCLHLFTTKLRLFFIDPHADQRALASLHFDYDGLIVPWHDARPLIHYFQEQKLQRFQRHYQAEKKALEMLELEFELSTVAETRGYGTEKNTAYENCFVLQNREYDAIGFDLYYVPELKKLGWKITYAEDYPFHVLHSDEVPWYSEIGEDSGMQWFDLEFGIEVGGKRINMLPILATALTKINITKDAEKKSGVIVPLPNGNQLVLPYARIERILEILTELYNTQPLTQDNKLRLPRWHAGRLNELEMLPQQSINYAGGGMIKALVEKLKSFSGIGESALPKIFKADLRPYQKTGVNWLQFLRDYQFGGILADDMGLGKTMQTLAHIAIEKHAGRMTAPCLVIAPTSLMFNWQMEAQRFVPTLKVLILQGQIRKQFFADIQHYDLVLTTYPLLPRDHEILLKQPFYLLILDEAQNIKNIKSQATQIVQHIKAQHRLCLTGTPIENHLGELWSLMNFLMPGFLGDVRQFQRLYRAPIEKLQNEERRQQLVRRISPFILRRNKSDILKELPPKIEAVHYVDLEEKTRDLYETIRASMHEKLRKQIAQMGFARSQIMILDALLKLRQICCDPRLLKMEIKNKHKLKSAKLTALMELLPESIEEGRRILLFSQFTEMLALIEKELQAKKIHYQILTGKTKDRASLVKQFQVGNIPLFLISLKAGGTGLNLTAADTVIHYDPWWNPAVENQATDRAHRIGQDKKVFVYKLMTRNTVEEKILLLQEKKRALVEGILSGKMTGHTAFTAEDLEFLFSSE